MAGKLKNKKTKGKGVTKKKEELINIPPPTPVVVEKESAIVPGSMVEYICQFDGCDLPDRKFTRIKKGGRSPLYCSDAHRNAANYARNASNGGSTSSRATLDRQLLDLFFKESELKVNKEGNKVKIKVSEFTVPDTLVAVLTQAIRRSNEATTE